MQINQYEYPNNTSFRGYDARPLKGFLMSENFHGITDDMVQIAKKEGFKIYSLTKRNGRNICVEGSQPICWMSFNTWAQDYWTFVNGKLLSSSMKPISDAIKEFFGINNSTLKSAINDKHISGGNLFIVKNGDKDEVFVGADDVISKQAEVFSSLSFTDRNTIDEIKAKYGVEKVVVIPQIDYHLDLFIRPLDDKRVLLTDDNLSMAVIKDMREKLVDYISNKTTEENLEEYKNALSKIDEFLVEHDLNIKEQEKCIADKVTSDDVEKVLKENGYDVIRVPGALYNYKKVRNFLTKQYLFNFMNANVLKNEQGEIVYITNKSNLDEDFGLTPDVKEVSGGGVEDSFIKAISLYVKPEHHYFVSGKDNAVAKQMLPKLLGGIHCACTEIPEC